MSKASFFIGEPVTFKKGVKIYPPKIKDVVSNPHFSLFGRMLTYSQEEIEDIFVKEKKDLTSFPTPMEFLLGNCYNSKEFEILCKEAFEFFLKTKVDFLYDQKKILIGDLEQVLKGL